MLLDELIELIRIKEIKNKRNLTARIQGIAYNASKIKDNYLFVAIEGFKEDGHSFIETAIENGASALLVEKDIANNYNIPIIKTRDSRLALAKLSKAFYNSADEKILIIGITGTNGKTTTAFLIEGICNKLGFKTALISTEKNKIGNKEVSAQLTTPESLNLHNFFQQMLNNQVDFAVVEVSSHSLKLNRVAGVDFDRQIFTNLGKDHLSFHDDVDDYFAAKAKLFEANKKPAIINIDDDYGKQMQEKAAGEVITYGLDKAADFRATEIKSDLTGLSYSLEMPEGRYKVKLNLLGEVNVYNSLAAIATLVSFDFKIEKILDSISQIKGVSKRLEILQKNPLIIIDGAHNHQGISSLKKTLASFELGKIFVVLAIYKDKNIDDMLKKVSSFATEIIISENSKKRTAGVELLTKKAAKYTKSYTVIKDLEEAIDYSCQQAGKKDLILITGSLQTAAEAYELVEGSDK